MDIRRLKLIVVFLLVIVIVASVCFVIYRSIEGPKMEKELEAKIVTNLGVNPVITALKDILPEEVITYDMVGISNSTVLNFDAQNYTTNIDDVVGKIARTKIYAGETIIINRLDINPQDSQWKTDKDTGEKLIRDDIRKVTFDVPAYGFVNGNVIEGTLVDLMLDEGEGKFTEILSHIYVYEIKEIPEEQKWQNLANEPKGEENELTSGQKLANKATTDMRVTILASSDEQQKIFNAKKEGKFFFRLHISERDDETNI